MRIGQWLRAYPLDLLHTNETGCDVSPIAARLAGVRRVLGTYHVDTTYDLHREHSGLSNRIVEFVSNRSLTRAIGVSRATGVDWIRRARMPVGRVVTIPNGVDPEAFRRRVEPAVARRELGLQANGEIYVGGVGRLHDHKGFEYLIRAAAILHKTHPALRVVLAGTGSLHDPLLKLAHTLGVADRVILLGFQADVRKVLEALDIFVLSSLCEAMPYALLEAMSVGLPVVATKVGGVPEAVVDGRTGLLVPPRDPAALATALARLLNDDQFRLAQGTAARERIIHWFDQSARVRQTINVYRTLLGNEVGAARRRI